jgi:hypothetical protein
VLKRCGTSAAECHARVMMVTTTKATSDDCARAKSLLLGLLPLLECVNPVLRGGDYTYDSPDRDVVDVCVDAAGVTAAQEATALGTDCEDMAVQAFRHYHGALTEAALAVLNDADHGGGFLKHDDNDKTLARAWLHGVVPLGRLRRAVGLLAPHNYGHCFCVFEPNPGNALAKALGHGGFVVVECTAPGFNSCCLGPGARMARGGGGGRGDRRWGTGGGGALEELQSDAVGSACFMAPSWQAAHCAGVTCVAFVEEDDGETWQRALMCPRTGALGWPVR